MNRIRARRRGFVALLSAGVVAATAACGPFGPFAGGRLSGSVVDEPRPDWSFAAQEETAQLETRPDDPHSVNTWFVALGPDLYVPTSMILGPVHPEGRDWVAHVEADPRVRIRLVGRLFDRRVVRVEGEEYARAHEALRAKYALSEIDPERTIWIFRLDPRAR